jgi:hypothetical protein
MRATGYEIVEDELVTVEATPVKTWIRPADHLEMRTPTLVVAQCVDRMPRRDPNARLLCWLPALPAVDAL